MGYDAPDIYNQPEHFGLKTIGTVSWNNDSYQFDFSVVWIHESGKFYVGSDSGCSCPSPFEDATLESAVAFDTVHEVMAWLDNQVEQAKGGYSWETDGPAIEADVLDLKSKLMKMRTTDEDVRKAIESIRNVARNA